jgi:hypothetical protein
MRLIGGPFNGRYTQTDGSDVGEQLDFQGRCKIDSAWYDVDHLYEVQEDGSAVYQFSQFEWRETLR